MFRKISAAILIVLSLVMTAYAVTVTVDDVIKLHKQGVGVEVIKTFIKSSGQKFELTADDILRMKAEGVPDDIIDLMLKSGQPTVTPPPQQTTTQNGEVSPSFPYVARYHSVYNFYVAEKKRLRSIKVLEVGKRDPLKNTAKRAGTMILTDSDLIFYDMDGDERFRVSFTEVTELKIETRFKDKVEASYHPLDTTVLWIYCKKDGKDFVVRVLTLPKPDKKDPNYGDVADIAKAIQEIGQKVNPKLAEPIKME